MLSLFKTAIEHAIARKDEEAKYFLHSAIGVRADGAIVKARNLPVMMERKGANGSVWPFMHAESLLVRKIDSGAQILVVRVRRLDGALGMSRPCKGCQCLLRAYKVKKVYYSISNLEYGIWYPKTDEDRIYQF